MNSITKKWQELANERLMLMQKLSAQHKEIAKLKELNGRAARAIEYIEKVVQLGNKNFELTRMEREFITELREAAE